MRDYVDRFRSTPSETLQQRLENKRLSPKAADAYRQVLAERAAYVPFDILGEISVSGHSGCYYVSPDKGQQFPKVFDGQSESGFLINFDLVRKHDLDDEDRIVFQVGPDMTWVTMIKLVVKAPPTTGPTTQTMTGPRDIHP